MPKDAKTQEQSRETRLAEALRANLRRRKAKAEPKPAPRANADDES